MEMDFVLEEMEERKIRERKIERNKMSG